MRTQRIEKKIDDIDLQIVFAEEISKEEPSLREIDLVYLLVIANLGSKFSFGLRTEDLNGPAQTVSQLELFEKAQGKGK